MNNASGSKVLQAVPTTALASGLGIGFHNVQTYVHGSQGCKVKRNTSRLEAAARNKGAHKMGQWFSHSTRNKRRVPNHSFKLRDEDPRASSIELDVYSGADQPLGSPVSPRPSFIQNNRCVKLRFFLLTLWQPQNVIMLIFLMCLGGCSTGLALLVNLGIDNLTKCVAQAFNFINFLQ